MSKKIFFDIDGTLIDMKLGIKEISKETKETLDELKEIGHDIFIATGRCYCFINEGVSNYPFSGYVTSNGAYVEYKGKTIYEALISEEAIRKTIELSEQYGFNYYFESRDKIYIRDKKDKEHIEFAKNWGMKETVTVDTFDPSTIKANIGMIVIHDKSEIPLVYEALGNYFNIQRHQSDCSFDLTIQGESKAKGINKLMEELNDTMENTIAFGDGRNDIEMIEAVNIGIAMGNSVQELKAIADYITDDVDKNGITKALMKLDIIEKRPIY